MAIYFLQSLQQKETKLRPLFTQAAEPLQGDTLLLTTKLPGVAATTKYPDNNVNYNPTFGGFLVA